MRRKYGERLPSIVLSSRLISPRFLSKYISSYAHSFFKNLSNLLPSRFFLTHTLLCTRFMLVKDTKKYALQLRLRSLKISIIIVMERNKRNGFRGEQKWNLRKLMNFTDSPHRSRNHSKDLSIVYKYYKQMHRSLLLFNNSFPIRTT